VFLAAHAGDHAIYPDCRAEFTEAMSRAASLGTYAEVKIVAPYSQMSKRDIAKLGRRLEVDFAQTYSCYKGGELHCGTCGTCTERREALQGFDPTEYLR
jgi:7-cyano-7-deazaguanine synthase